MLYSVVAIGGKSDGKIIDEFTDVDKAIKCAEDNFEKYHAEEPAWGGTMILDANGGTVEW